MREDYPTKDELKRIEEWDYKDCEGLAEHVCEMWKYDDYAFMSDWKLDEFGSQYRMLWLATGGWSGNEDIVGALNRNTMFNMLCWVGSQRGGLHIYHIKKLEKESAPENE